MTKEQEIRNKIKIFRPTSQEVNLIDPSLNDKSTRLFKFKDNQDNKFKIWVFTNSLKLEIPLMTSLFFSINIPDKVCFADKKLKEIYGIGTIFTNNSINEQIIICLDLLKDDFKSLNFENNEGLTVYKNALQFIFNYNRKLLPEIEICKKIKTIIEFNFPDIVERKNYSNLPKNLRRICLKYEKFAVTDDLERDDLIEGISAKQRKDLIKIIEPKFEKINLFLDKFSEKSLTEEAIVLQCLVELTIELMNDQKNYYVI